MSERKPDDRKLWNFEVGLEVSTRYHDWRRANLDFYAGVTRAVTLVGAVVALVFAFRGDDLRIASLAAAVAAVFALIDLVYRFDIGARRHTELYRRFKTLQANVARWRGEWTERLPEWEEEVQLVRLDEPPVFWAIYAICWNQTLARRGVGAAEWRRVGFWHHRLRYVFPFKPQDFPLASGASGS